MISQKQGKIEPNDFCSQHMSKIAICEVCGGGVLNPFIEVNNENEVHVYCPNCMIQRRMQEEIQFQNQNP